MQRTFLIFVLLAVAACGSGPVGGSPSTREGVASPAASSPAPAATGSTIPTTTPTTPPTTTVAEASPREIRVVVSGGDVQGGGRVEVPLGARVVLLVEADRPDEVHVHTYDLAARVAPGEPARIEFTADIPGVFEVELEEAGVLLLQLEVAP